jgi:2-phospho-L-lactate guanylyltransferase
MKQWLIVPVKPFDKAKSRLAGVLPDATRAELSAQLLEQTLRIAVATDLFAQIAVVSRDPAALTAAAALGAIGLVENLADLNGALAQACGYAHASGADAALLLPADLPRLRQQDLVEVVEAFLSHPHTVVLAPSRDGGTNALMLPLPTPFPFAFGPDSHCVHRALATAAGYTTTVVNSPTLAFDLDSPADLCEFVADAACQLPVKSEIVRNIYKMP